MKLNLNHSHVAPAPLLPSHHREAQQYPQMTQWTQFSPLCNPVCAEICIHDFKCPCLLIFKCFKICSWSPPEVWWGACASGWLITWPGDPNKSDSSKLWSGTSQIPSPPQYQGSLNLLTRLPLFASLTPAFTVGYFNIRDERHNPFLTFVSFIWVPYNGFRVSCLSIHRAKANFRMMQWERGEYL